MDILNELVAKGVAGEVIVAVAKLIAEAELLQRQRDANRERMRVARASVSTRVDTGMHTGNLALSLPSSATTSTVVQEKKVELVALEREFHEIFWPAYPNKVAKPAALKAYLRARKRASLETIMAGLERYANKTDDRHWANGATWLNNDRWEDQPGPAQEGNGHGRRGQPAPKDDPKSIRGAFDRLFARLDGGDEFGEPSRQTNLRVIPGGSG